MAPKPKSKVGLSEDSEEYDSTGAGKKPSAKSKKKAGSKKSGAGDDVETSMGQVNLEDYDSDDFEQAGSDWEPNPWTKASSKGGKKQQAANDEDEDDEEEEEEDEEEDDDEEENVAPKAKKGARADPSKAGKSKKQSSK